MDLFYKPPLERPDECQSLEENYLNCLMQKALRDKVLNNRCNLDSVLWFHLECPKAVSKFDDPLEFKRKFRDFFAFQRTQLENITNMSEEAKTIQENYNYLPYPEDVKEKKVLRQFKEQFEEFSPATHPETMEEFENEDRDESDEPTDLKEMDYGKRPEWAKVRPIRKDESLKKRD